MHKRTDMDLLNDISICLNKIIEYTKGFTFETFEGDPKTQDAIIRNLEVIGEASKSVSQEFKKRHTKIPWKLMAGTRDRLIHGYAGINIDIIWEIVTIDAPKLRVELEKITGKTGQ